MFSYIFFHHDSRWWFQICFMFTPKIGEMIHFDEHIFQMGWFNMVQPPTRLYQSLTGRNCLPYIHGWCYRKLGDFTPCKEELFQASCRGELYGYFTQLILMIGSKSTIPCSTPSRYVSKIDGGPSIFCCFSKNRFFQIG